MNTYLLDTNVVSYLFRGHSLGSTYQSMIQGVRPAISFMTIAELHEGALRAGWGSTKLQRLDTEIAKYVVVHSSDDQCRIWGEIRAARRQQPISVDDAWIAAAAVELSLPLVTHNRADFDGIPNLTVISASP